MGAVKRSPRFLYRNIVLHLLAFAVIAFGLEAKLALYKKAPEPVIAAAKLSTEKNSSKVISAIGKVYPVKRSLDLDALALRQLIQTRGTAAAIPVRSAKISLIASIRIHDQGVSHFHRPPPALL